MKTLAATAIILSLSLSGPAYAINAADTQHYDDFYPASHNAGRTGYQPEIGSMLTGGFIPASTSNFWQEHGKLLDRHSNEVDSSTYDQYAYENGGRTWNQPEIGSMTSGISLPGGSNNFWAENEDFMYRNNPLK